MEKFTERDVYNHLYCKIFNTDVYEVFPELEECLKRDYDAVTGFLEDFLIDLYDLSKPIVKPFVDERSTYAYRSLYGINNFGIAQSMTSIGEQLSLSRSRVRQIIRSTDIALINMIISEFKAYKNNQNSDIMIEEVGLSKSIYNKLKRCGINNVSEIDFDSLQYLNGFGKKSCMEVARGVSRVKNKDCNR